MKRNLKLAALPLGLMALILSIGISGLSKSFAGLQQLSILSFLLFGLGLSIIQFLEFESLAEKVLYSFALSLSLLTGLAMLMIYGNWWEPQFTFVALLALSTGLCLLRLGQLFYVPDT